MDVRDCGHNVATSQTENLNCGHNWPTVPPMRKSSTKTDLLKIRVSEAERAAFQDAAAIAGITVSAWARERLRRAAVRDLQDASRPVPFLEKSRISNGRN